MITLVPAYGRDYKSKKEVMKDFNENKDFIINDISSRWDGKPANKNDLIKDHDEVKIRYKKHQEIAIVKVD